MMKFRLSTEVYLWALIYFAATTLFHWRLTPDLTILFYLIGAIIGLHLIELMERIFGGSSSPFRNVLFQAVLTVLTLFVVTSSGSRLGAGVVLFLNLRYWYLQYKEFYQKKTLVSWFGQNTPLTEKNQQTYLMILTAIFILETFLFILI